MPKFFFRYRYILLLAVIISFLYYKFFLFGKIPFPADLLVGSYLPWLDYYKIPVQNPLISDVFSQFFLWKYLSIDAFKNLQWPLWNPYSFMGTPLLATYHSAALYPLNLLLLLPKYTGWGFFVFSSTLFAAINMYLLLSLWTSSKIARFCGSIIFALGGLMTTWVELGTAVHAMAWLPLSLFSVELYLQTSKLRYLFLEIISLTLLILAGNAQVATYSFAVVAIYSCINKFLPLSLALIITIFLNAVQLLPSIDLLGKSIRLTEIYTSEVNFGLLPLKELLKFSLADFFGNPVTGNYWGFLNYSETSSFVGTLTLPLILFSVIYLKRNSTSIFFLVTLFLSLILTFDNPISSSIYQLKIPLFTSSFASRILFMSIFSTAVLAALSLNQIISAKEEGKFFKTVVWSWAAIFGILLGTALSNFSISFRNSILPTLLITLYLIIFFLFKKKHSLIFIVLLIFLVFDLGRYFLKFNPFVTKDLIFPTTPAIEYLQKNSGNFRLGREHAEVLPPNTWIAYNLQSLEGYDPLYLNQYGKFMDYLNGGDLRSGNSSRYAELSQKYNSPFIDSANVKYFIGILRDKNNNIGGNLINSKFLEAGYKPVFQDGSTVILENPNVKERAYFANSIRILKTSEIEETIMLDKSFDPRKTILLPDNLLIGNVSGEGKIKILSYTPNKIVLRTETAKAELLILADQFEDGWKAEVDGENTKISKANLIFRAVKIPSGSHEVIFSYWPKSFDLGLKISLTTLGIIVLMSLSAVKMQKF
ncbi:YfhO family protein [Candidatus Daviesbacteria bacterium]|nr:YfhO family protein [Candidatus Daviesbacteria bacterium]